MKPSRGEKRLGPGQDDLDRLGLRTGANVFPCHTMPTGRKALILKFSIKRKAAITRLWGLHGQGPG